MANYPVDHSRSDALPQGIARAVVHELESSYFALAAARAEAEEEGVLEAFDAAAEGVEADVVEFYKTVQKLIAAGLKGAQPANDRIIAKLRKGRIAAFKAKQDGYERDEPQAVTRQNTFVASRLNALLWAAMIEQYNAAGQLGLTVPGWALGFATQTTSDPDFWGNVLRSEAGTGSGGIGIGGTKSPFKG